MNFIEGSQECDRLGMYIPKDHGVSMTNIDWKLLTKGSMVWIGNQIKKQQNNNDSNKTSKDKIIQDSFYCQAWSIRKSEFQSVPCDTELGVFCQADLIGTYDVPQWARKIKKSPGQKNF